jgi:flagellar biogenesis protein FliO
VIILGWLLATASATGLDAVSIWGTPASPVVEALAPPAQAPSGDDQRVAAPTDAHTDAPTDAPTEPVIVPRRLQAAMDAAPAGPSDQAELNRLLGPDPVAAASAAPMGAPSKLPGLWWMLPVVGLLGGANWWLRKKGRFGALRTAEIPLKIVARQSLGGTNQLLLVEVEDPDGSSRRLLIGTGTDGPRLVSEFHPQTDFERLIAETAAEPVVAPAVAEAARGPESLASSAAVPRLRTVPTPAPEAPTAAVAESPKLAPPPPSNPVTYATRRYRQINRVSAGRPPQGAPAPLAERRQEARSLVDEVLASREENGWTA